MRFIEKQKENDQFKWYTRAAVIAVLDCITILCSYFLALYMRHDFVFANIPEYFIHAFIWSMPFWIIATIVVFYVFRLYHSIWSFASMPELQMIMVQVQYL